jgi:hypothetical protein
MKDKDDHKIRVHYIISRAIEYKFITRTMTTKLKDWILRNREAVSGGTLGSTIQPICEYYHTHKDVIDNLVHHGAHAAERLFQLPILHDAEDPDKPFYKLHPEQLFDNPGYIDEANYLTDLAAIEVQVIYEGESKTVRMPSERWLR